jgi:hypothetical protein
LHVILLPVMNSSGIQILFWVAAGAITLFLPGAAVLSWFPRRDLDFAQQVGRILGMSMALTALGGLATFLTGVSLTSFSLAAIYGGLGIITGVGIFRHHRSSKFSKSDWITLGSLVFLGIGLIAWRLYQTRDLVFPAWVDSVNHVLIVKAILNQGGLPGVLTPDLPVPFYYHYGFHVLAAVFSFWSRLPADQAVLILGNVLEAAMSLAIYRLGCVLWNHLGRREAMARGLAAALLVGFATHMPGYYLTWGRYTLLAGLILLGFCLAEGIEIVQNRLGRDPERPGFQIRPLIPFALMVSGVLLTHYLVAILLGLFVVFQTAAMWGLDLRDRNLRPEKWLPLLGSAAIGTLLAGPWLTRVLIHSLPSFTLNVVLPAQSGGAGYSQYLWYLAGPQRNYWLLLFAVLGLGLALSKPETRVFGVWCLVSAGLCIPVGIRLGPLRPDIMVMMIFFPEVLLAGHFLVKAGETLGNVSRRIWLGRTAILLGVILFCLWGVKETAQIINPVTVLADQTDRAAITWIQQNLPENAYFYINTTPWQESIYRGVDGGWWILPLTGRQTLLPPVAYAWGPVDWVHQVNAWAQQASQITGCSPEFWQVVHSSGVNYIYLHQGVGSLQPSGLEGCTGIELVYQSDGVFIYYISP